MRGRIAFGGISAMKATLGVLSPFELLIDDYLSSKFSNDSCIKSLMNSHGILYEEPCTFNVFCRYCRHILLVDVSTRDLMCVHVFNSNLLVQICFFVCCSTLQWSPL